MTCDDRLLALLLGGPLDAETRVHVSSCPRCGAEEPVIRALGRSLAHGTVPEPRAGLEARLLAATGPVLATHAGVARAPDWPRVRRALAVALLPLPLILLIDLSVLSALHTGLRYLLPGVLSGYLVATWAATLTVMLAATYAAVPLLAHRAGPAREGHG
jgi:hypothetical protein